jgi:hypothetical protein
MTEGLSLRVIGRKFKISPSTLSRHRPHIPDIKTPVEIFLPPADDSVIDQLKALIADSKRIARKAETSGHLQSAVAALKTINGHLELLARLSGELSNTGVAVQVNVGVGVRDKARWGDSSDAVLDWALARHIGHQITFEPQAIERLKLLNAAPCPQCERFGCKHDTAI